MKRLLLFTIALLIVLFLPVVVADIPDTVINTDSNPIISEIIVNSSSDIETEFVIQLPYPYSYSEGSESMRVYDSDGNLVPFSVGAVTNGYYFIVVKETLVAGENYFYVTMGNDSLSSVQDTSVYTTYSTSTTTGNSTIEDANWAFLEYGHTADYYNADVKFSWLNGSQTNAYVTYRYTNSGFQYTISDNSSNKLGYVDGNRWPVTLTHVVDNVGSMNYATWKFVGGTISEMRYPINNTGNITVFNATSNNLTYPAGLTRVVKSIYQPDTITVLHGSDFMKDGFFALVFFDPRNGVPFRMDTHYHNTAIDETYHLLNNTNSTFNFPNSYLANSVNSSTYRLMLVDNTYINNQSLSSLKNGTYWGVASMNAWTFILEKNDSISIKNNKSFVFYRDNIINSTFSTDIYDEGWVPVLPDSFNIRWGNTYASGAVLIAVENGTHKPITGINYETTSGATTLSEKGVSSDGGAMIRASTNYSDTILFNISGVNIINGSHLMSTAQGINYTGYDMFVVDATYNISIRVIDSDTDDVVQSFTTFLGQNQSIKSTDNGTVVYRNVVGGENEVIIQADGYNQVSRGIFVSKDEEVFTLQISKSTGQEYTTPHYVRLFYRTITGTPITGLNIDVFDSNGEVLLYQAVTGTDGSVSFELNETIQYRFIAQNGETIVNDFTVFPKSSEYIVIVGSNVIVDPPSDVLSSMMYSISEENTGSLLRMRAALDTTTINASMWSNSSSVVNYNIIAYQENTVLETRTGNFTGIHSETFTVPTGHVYTISITFTDVDEKVRTVSKTLRLDGTSVSDKIKFSIPGFTENWHYSLFCVFIVLVSAFSFSARTKRAAGLIIPGEMALMGYVGWIDLTSFAICLLVAAVIMSLVYFAEKAGSDESLS